METLSQILLPPTSPATDILYRTFFMTFWCNCEMWHFLACGMFCQLYTKLWNISLKIHLFMGYGYLTYFWGKQACSEVFDIKVGYYKQEAIPISIYILTCCMLFHADRLFVLPQIIQPCHMCPRDHSEHSQSGCLPESLYTAALFLIGHQNKQLQMISITMYHLI